MNAIKNYRIESIDLLRGVVMIIMALDHVRDYFHAAAFVSDPTNMETTTIVLFFTRFITHYCAPVFIFLAGTSAYLYGTKKTKAELFNFLWTRGLWLIFIEVTVMTLLWWFDLTFGFFNLQVIWAIGLCMVFLSGLIYLPKKVLIGLGLLLVFGHNILDGIVMEGTGISAILWYVFHQSTFVQIGDTWISFLYPILPWIGVISLGYVFGALYTKEFDPGLRKKWLMRLGLSAIGLFIVLRAMNGYGNLTPWSAQKNIAFTVLSFFNVTKYPPSLLFLLITLGPAFLFLRFTESCKNKLTDFALVFGRVPLFYYVIHVFVIHIVAILGIIINGGDWTLMLITMDKLLNGSLAGYGYSLGTVYLIWIAIVLALYPISKWYMNYKANNRHKWWLKYL